MQGQNLSQVVKAVGSPQYVSANEVKNDTNVPVSLVAVELSPGISFEALEWLQSKIQAKKLQGGAELQLQVVHVSHNRGTILLLRADSERLLHGAEELELLKQHKDGIMRPFVYRDRYNFYRFEESGDHFLTSAEHLCIIKHGLDNLRVKNEDIIPGELKLLPGHAVFSVWHSDNLVVKVYPLHNLKELEKLKKKWYMKFQLLRQPLQSIRDYFGESVALYFSFLDFFTWGIFFRTVFALFYHFLGSKGVGDYAFFAFYNIVWATVLLEVWKRQSNILTFKWGTLQKIEYFDEPRLGFKGSPGVNPITGHKEPTFPSNQRYLRLFLVSVPFVGISLLISCMVMGVYLWVEQMAEGNNKEQQTTLSYVMTYVPEVGYTIAIEVLNKVYLKLVHDLTEWENHREASTHENYLMTKIIIFYFINNFGIHFYTAFWLNDFQELRENLATQLITYQIISQILESVLPYWLATRNVRSLRSLYSQEVPALQQIFVEGNLETFESLSDDYLELFLMFGYMTLFSSIYPLAALWCFLNNLTEIPLDALKLCNNFQRPFPVRSSSIGVWQLAFQCFGTLAIITNCAILGMSPEFRALFKDLSEVQFLLLLVATEHVIVAIKELIAYIIPDVPETIQIQLMKLEYQARQALKKKKVRNIYAKDEEKKTS